MISQPKYCTISVVIPFLTLFLIIVTTSIGQDLKNITPINIDSIRLWDDIPIIEELYDNKDHEQILLVIDSLENVDFNRASFYAELQRHKAKSLIKMIRFDEADQAIEIAKTYWRTSPDSLNHEYATLIGYQGDIEEERGNYAKSEKLSLRGLEILKDFHGDQSEHFAIGIANMANSYQSFGNYKKAEEYFLIALPLMKMINGDNSMEVLGVTNNFAIMLSDIGSFEKSTKYLEDCVSVTGELLGEEHLYYAVFSNNLARDYNRIEEYEKAVVVLEKAIELTAEHAGTDIPQYGTMQGNLGMSYNGLGQHDKAEELYLNNLELKRRLYGERNISTIHSLNNLASLYNEIGRSKESEELFLETLSIIEESDGKFHRKYTTTLKNLAELYTNTEQYEKVQNLLEEYYLLNKHHIVNGMSYFSDDEQKNYIKRLGSNYRLLKSIGLINPSKSYNKTLYDLALFEKGIMLNNSISVKRFIAEQEDPEIIQTYSSLVDLRQRVGKELEKPESARLNIDSLELEVEGLEKILAKVSSEFRNNLSTKNINSEDILNQLSDKEIAIEFNHFTYADPKITDSIYYVATILDPSTNSVEYVMLFEEKQMSLFNQNKSRRSDYVNVLYSNKTKGLNIRGKEYESLYDLIWKPLLPYLEGKGKIYYSASGLLNRINLEAIYSDANSIMSETYEMWSLSSTKSVVTTDNTTSDISNTAYILGGVNYNDSLLDESYSAVETKSQFLLDRSLTSNEWRYLPWTATECESIEKTLGKNNFTIDYKNGNEATEESFKELGVSTKSPRIIHLATHGFFFPDPKKEDQVDEALIFKVSEEPMLRSGLLLSGSNLKWKDEKTREGKEDGILTALEISNINLSNTELVVLSACETGLGDIDGTEGVYGLQRAFKQAGVKYLIMSLWQVPDEQTSQFMDQFYINWLQKGKSIREAFRQTQSDMKKKLKDPYQWAGFVLIE